MNSVTALWEEKKRLGIRNTYYYMGIQHTTYHQRARNFAFIIISTCPVTQLNHMLVVTQGEVHICIHIVLFTKIHIYGES